MSNKIKHCPTCGCDEILMVARADLRPTMNAIECGNRSCPAPLKTKLFKSLSEAIAAWNTRSAPTMQPWEWKRQGETEACLDFQASVYRNEGEATWTGFVGFARFVAADTIDDAKAACIAFVQGQLDAWLA